MYTQSTYIEGIHQWNGADKERETQNKKTHKKSLSLSTRAIVSTHLERGVDRCVRDGRLGTSRKGNPARRWENETEKQRAGRNKFKNAFLDHFAKVSTRRRHYPCYRPNRRLPSRADGDTSGRRWHRVPPRSPPPLPPPLPRCRRCCCFARCPFPRAAGPSIRERWRPCLSGRGP